MPEIDLSDIHASYVSPSERHWQNLVEQGKSPDAKVIFQISKSGSDGRERIDWTSKEQDFQILDRVADMIIDTLHLDDSVYRGNVLPKIQSLLFQSPLYQSLDDPSIPRSAAHSSRTPFQHIMDVAHLTDSDGFDNDSKFWLRFDPLIHDPGKASIAQLDYYQMHAKISALIKQEYLHSRGVSTEKSVEWSRTVKYHHVLELINRGILTHEEVQALFDREVTQIQMLGNLALADAWSVEKNQPFALANAKEFLTFFEQLKRLTETTKEFLLQFALTILEYAKKVGDTAYEELLSAVGQLFETLHIRQNLLPKRATV